MAEKHVAVCDHCGVEEPLTFSSYNDFGFPEGWLALGRARVKAVEIGGEHWQFCSWSCLRDFAPPQAATAQIQSLGPEA